MKTEIIAVGTELLMGYIVDTNTSTIAQELLDIGIGTYHLQTVGDNPERIKDALTLASSRSDIIILTGGLGPTQDDITKQVVAKFVGDELVRDEKQMDHIYKVFEQRGDTPSENVYREALTLKNGRTILNEVGLACGTSFELEREGSSPQHFILLPGVPYEMTYMLKNEVKPYLLEKVPTEGVIESLYLNFNGIGEARLATELDERILNQTNPTIAMYAKPKHVTIRLTANAENAEAAKELNRQVADAIIKQLPSYFIGYGEEQTVETFVVDLLKKHQLTLSVIEGFTGGALMEALTGVAGVSSVFEGGLVTANHATTEMLFNLTDLKNEPEEARAVTLAEKCADKFQTAIGLSVTASTESAPDGKRLSGTGYVAIARQGEKTQVKSLPLPEKPNDILRTILKNEALAFLKQTVE